MDREQVVEELTGSWEATRPVRDALVRRGAEVVGPVLEVLCDERSPVELTVSSDVLCRIGHHALLPLAGAIASADSPEVARRAGYALGRLQVHDPAVYLPLLTHPHPKVRADALLAFQRLGEAALAFADRLTPSLGDADTEVRRRAVWAFEAIGGAAVPVLRRLRRSPAPAPRLRAGALEALAAIGGPTALDEPDRNAVRRLTRIKQIGEVPEGMHLCGSWYAVPTADRRAVLEAFDLDAGEPVTVRTGAAAWNHDHHVWSGRGHRACARVFVSPVLDGFTLVFGDSSQDTHRIEDGGDDGRDEARERVVRERCADLSRRFGAAQWYGTSCGDGWTAWCVAEDGEVVRYYDAYDAEETGDAGPGHPAEAGYLLPHEGGFPEDAFDGDNLIAIPDTCYAVDIAARLSVDPASIGAATQVRGHGLLALTACGREQGHPAGALPV
ncbi:HEAT repeat domain-containing protein [Streptomyces sp. NBC_00555]|uniref:HEAT repeat domain-containing protein n=1 Tax=Streptomyces sp. NBC_00555 TaxID=2903662 RepID=UPI002254E718|nr:HEAT repeat domain-containing protein [Streptomyces sp. NBC_00555]MCX5015323.1 HEAT repeat domain-containing protein [Streptomyces sp. NBC_00555]